MSAGIFLGEFNYVDFLTGELDGDFAGGAEGAGYLLYKDYREPGYLKRFEDAATALLKAFALAGATDEAQKIRREVAFFQTVKAAETKTRGNVVDRCRPCGEAVGRSGDRAAGSGGHLRGGWVREAGYLDSVGGVPARCGGECRRRIWRWNCWSDC